MGFSEKSLHIKRSQLPDAGKGLFTRAQIKRGERITEYRGKIRRWKDVKHTDGYNGYLLRLSRTTAIDARPTLNAKGRYANDAQGVVRKSALRNNAQYLIYGDRCFIEAARTIQPGEEIFVGYGREFWDLQKKLLAKNQKGSTITARRRKATNR